MANSFHLLWNGRPVENYSEISVIFRCLEKPNSDLVYWAAQTSFRQPDGTHRAGVHFGLQTAQNKGNATKTAVNLGGYDDVLPKLGDGSSPTLRGSYSTIPGAGTDYNSPLFEWFPDRDYLLRFFKSPKQNWLNAELDTPAGNTSGDQRADEIAWRCTITDLTTGIETHIRDLLISNCHTGEAMHTPMMWSEDFNDLTPPTATVPWDIRWRDTRLNRRLATQFEINYTDVNTNVNSFVDSVGIRQRSVVARTNADAVILTHPGPVVRGVSVDSPDVDQSTVTLAVDPAAVTGDLLLAVIGGHAGQSVPTSPGWTLLESVAGGTDSRHTTLYRRHDGVTMSHVFTIGNNTQNLAGAMLSIFRADEFAIPLLGAVGQTDAGATDWTAPATERATNYPLVLVAVVSVNQGAGTDIRWPVGIIEVADSDDAVTPSANQSVAFGVEPVPQVSGSSPIRSGTYVDGAVWRSQARQIIIPPPLNRVVPVSDLANTGFTVAPLWSKVASFDDGSTISGGNAATCTLPLGTPPDPVIHEGHVLRYKVRRQNANSASALVELLQGTTVIASKTETILTGDAYVQGALTLTTTEAGTITNYADLRLRLTVTTT